MKPKNIADDDEESYPSDCFAVNRILLILSGLWVPKFNSKILYYLFKLYALWVLVYVNILYTSSEFVSLIYTYNSADKLTKNINFALTHLMGCMKCMFWHWRHKELIRIMNTMENTEFRYENFEEFKPGVIFRKAKATGIRYAITFYLLGQLTVLSSYIPVVYTAVFAPIYHIDEETGESNIDQHMPYFSWIPFRYDTQRTLVVALFAQFSAVIQYAYSIIAMDTMFMNIMNFISAHFLVLQGAFRTIKGRCVLRLLEEEMPVEKGDGLHNSKELDEEMRKEFNKMTVHMQTVIGLSNDIEKYHKYVTLSQVLCTLFILCTSLFLVSTTPAKSKQFAGEFFYILTMTLEVILYCWFGNKVTERAQDVPLAIWESDWLGASKSLTTNMLITMTRMSKPIYLTVGRFTPLTVDTLVSILKASYSFFAVLKKTRTE